MQALMARSNDSCVADTESSLCIASDVGFSDTVVGSIGSITSSSRPQPASGGVDDNVGDGGCSGAVARVRVLARRAATHIACGASAGGSLNPWLSDRARSAVACGACGVLCSNTWSGTFRSASTAWEFSGAVELTEWRLLRAVTASVQRKK